MSDHDRILITICEIVQISEAKYERANQSYESVGNWLSAEGSVFAGDDLSVYPQGSFALQTTIRPQGERQEYDLDFVMELKAGGHRYRRDPKKLLDDLEDRLRQNKTYEEKIERKKRCVCIKYAGDFHMDILPALPAPYRGNTHKIVVPDRKLEEFKASNPKGYKAWFEQQSLPRMRKDAKYVEPLAPMQTAAQKSVLCNITQLSKRARDVDFQNPDTAPRSVVLTTLLAEHYGGSLNLLQAWSEALARIKDALFRARPGRIVVLNPTNEDEDFSEWWDNHPTEYDKFVEWLQNLHERVVSLGTLQGPAFYSALESLFGEHVVTQAINLQAKRTDSLRSSGQLNVQARGKTVGRLSTASSAATVTVRRNTFYGED